MFLREAWYVAAALSEFGSAEYTVPEVTSRPIARKILGEMIVMARFADGQIGAYEDACPHRRAPLSEGKMTPQGLRCGYHGLVYGPSGACVLAPFDSKIPGLAKLKVYPTVERFGWLWIWMGKPEAADPALLPAILEPYFDGRYRHVHGYHYVEAYYELLIDNLLDLSHVDIIHEGLLGTRFARQAKVDTSVSGTTLRSVRFCANQEAPPIFKQAFPGDQKIDFWADMRWQPPANYALEVVGAPVGAGRDAGIHIVNLDMMTPETETTTHYFWTHGRIWQTNDPMLDAQIYAAVDAAFDQDKTIIEGQQKRLPSGDIRGMRLAACAEDYANMRARAIVEKLYADEQAAG